MKEDEVEVKKENYDKRGWIRVVNGLSGFKSANLLGTVSCEEISNLSVISSCFHLGANPPLLGFVLRPHSKDSPRHSLVNIEETGYYTLNHITESIYRKAHQTSARYAAEVSEFQATGLSEEWYEGFKAPFVAEANIKLGMRCREILPIEANNTTLVIGEIERIFLPKDCLMVDGFVDIEGAGSLCVSGLDSYHTTSRLHRLSYAKPDRAIENLTIDGSVEE